MDNDQLSQENDISPEGVSRCPAQAYENFFVWGHTAGLCFPSFKNIPYKNMIIYINDLVSELQLQVGSMPLVSK